MTIEEMTALGDLVKVLGIPGLLMILLFLGSKPDPGWVFGSVYKAMKEDRDYWKDLAIRSMGLLADSSDAGEQAIRIAQSTTRTRAPAQRKRDSGHESNRQSPPT